VEGNHIVRNVMQKIGSLSIKVTLYTLAWTTKFNYPHMITRTETTTTKVLLLYCVIYTCYIDLPFDNTDTVIFQLHAFENPKHHS
jgi:hypothetical protein